MLRHIGSLAADRFFQIRTGSTMNAHSAFSSLRHLCLPVALLLATSSASAHEQHAHTHGQLTMDVAIDAKTIVIAVQSPLDNLLGFEHAPRNAEEKRKVEQARTALQEADTLWLPDPAARCTLQTVELDSEILAPAARSHDKADKHGHKHEHEHDHDHDHAAHDDHADLDATIVFACEKPELARFIDVKLFERFPNIRTVNAQVASPQGQFKRVLDPKSARLRWER